MRRLAVISGAGGSLFEDAIAQGADCLLTGEANHHHAIDAKRLGLSLIAAGHYATEFPVTAAVAEKLRTAFPELEVLVSEDARDPYTYLFYNIKKQIGRAGQALPICKKRGNTNGIGCRDTGTDGGGIEDHAG